MILTGQVFIVALMIMLIHGLAGVATVILPITHIITGTIIMIVIMADTTMVIMEEGAIETIITAIAVITMQVIGAADLLQLPNQED